MNATPSKSLSEPLGSVLALAHLLERLERSTQPVSAEQYRSVVDRLSQALARVPAGDALQAVLGAHPAAAELYENMNYQHAGLCRSPLDQALGAELKAREAIGRASRRG